MKPHECRHHWNDHHTSHEECYKDKCDVGRKCRTIPRTQTKLSTSFSVIDTLTIKKLLCHSTQQQCSRQMKYLKTFYAFSFLYQTEPIVNGNFFANNGEDLSNLYSASENDDIQM